MTAAMVGAEEARYFASPVLNGDFRLPHFMMGEYARALLEVAFERCDPLLSETDRAILGQLASPAAGTLPWSAAWTPALARLETQLVCSSDPAGVWEELVPLIVMLGAEGLLQEADVRLRAPQVIYWGTVKLPEADRIAFRRASANSATADLYRQGVRNARVSLVRTSEGLWTSGDAENVPIVWLGAHPIAMHSPENGLPYPIPTGRSVLPDGPARTAATFSEAAGLIAACSPVFLPWVGSAIRNVVPLDASDGVRMSATVEEFPGLTFLSFPGPAVEIAETLVHEASHHHYFALQRLTPLHDGSDTKEYYSPIKDRGRTIDLILFAFHAFGNAALFHRDVSNRDSRYLSLNGRTLEVSLERLRPLRSHLLETRALTEAGDTLWRPLAERLFGQTS